MRSSTSPRSPAPEHPTSRPRPSGSTRSRPTTSSRPPKHSTFKRIVVWASSETVLGLPFDTPPLFAPIDETIDPRPGDVVRALEAHGRGDGRPSSSAGRGSGSSACGSRTSWSPTDYARFPSFWDDATAPQMEPVGLRRRARRRAAAARLGLEADGRRGAEICIVAAADTVMTRPSADLMAEVYPTRAAAPRPVEGRETLLADRSRAASCSGTSRRTAGRTTSPRRGDG